MESTVDSVLLPPGAVAAKLIVCERTGRWAVALRRELADTSTRIHETRTIADCWQALEEAPSSFLLVELTAANAEGLLRKVVRLQRDFPLARLAVVADRCLAACEWLMREAGAVHFACSSRELGPLSSVIIRHLAQAPAPRQTLVERIWAGLPWKKLAE
jgi:hypothetical protein